MSKNNWRSPAELSKAEREQKAKAEEARTGKKPPPDNTQEGEGSPGLSIDGGGHA